MKRIFLALALVANTSVSAELKDPLAPDPAITAAVAEQASKLNLPDNLDTLGKMTGTARMDLMMRRFDPKQYLPIVDEMLRTAEHFEDARWMVPQTSAGDRMFERADRSAAQTFELGYKRIDLPPLTSFRAILTDIRMKLTSDKPEVRQQGEVLAEYTLDMPNRWFWPYLNALRKAPKHAIQERRLEARKQENERIAKAIEQQKAEQEQQAVKPKGAEWGGSLSQRGFMGTLEAIWDEILLLAGLGFALGLWLNRQSKRKSPFLSLKLSAAGAFAALLGGAVKLIGLDPISGWVSLAGAISGWVFIGRKLKPAPKTSHGSAAWADTQDLTNRGRILEKGRVLSDSHGFALGRMSNLSEDKYDQRFRYMGHVLTCAPTGAGKGIGAVIPNLLEYPGSALVLDIKGENYAVTAEQRRRMGHEVFLLDPFNVCGAESHAFNWLDRLNPDSPDVVSESAELADMLIVPDPKGDSHWDDSAKDLLRGLMVYVTGLSEADCHIGTVREILTSPEADLNQHLQAMQDHPEFGCGLAYRAANSFLSKADKERSGVLSSAIRHTSFLDDPRIVESLNRSDFDLTELKTKQMTVYIAMPPAKLAAYNRFMRCFIGQTLSGITSSQVPPKYKITFFLDEFAQLGRMSAIEDGISLMRGYGAAFWIYVQDLSQLKAVYPKWQTFLSNAAKQFYGTADYDTARYISDSLGQETIEFETVGSSYQNGLKGGGSVSDSTQRQGRNLLTPDEVMRLGPVPIVLINGEPPYMLQRLNYLSDSEYDGLYEKNPFH